MDFRTRVLEFRLLDNTVEDILWFAGILFAAFIFKRYISVLLGKLLYRVFRRYTVENRAEAFNRLLLPPMQLLVMLFIVMFGIELLYFPAVWRVNVLRWGLHGILMGLLQTAIAVSVTWMILRVVDFFASVAADRAAGTESKLDDQLVPFIKDAVKIVIVVFGLLFILGSVLHLNIASLIAGVGIGGLAIALAAQESLKNLFASITIFLDKPFTVGDFVTVAGITGTIENIGFRSSRIRTADKTYVTLPNTIMVEQAVDNQTKRTFRRVNMQLVLSFDTTAEQMRRIGSELFDFLRQSHRSIEYPIVRFDNIVANGLQLTVVYFLPVMEYRDFMRAREEVNFRILEIIQKHQSQFAKTLHQVEVLSSGEVRNEN
jgi:MscS family membrane protein